MRGRMTLVLARNSKEMEQVEGTSKSTRAKHPKQDYRVAAFDHSYHHLKIEAAAQIQFDETALSTFLASAMIAMFGLVDSAFPIDIIHVEPSTQTCIVRIPWGERDRLVRSMAAATNWHGIKCRVTHLKASPFLLNLL
jgi:Rpp14/Pop5 family